jgi:hypothetical protein
MIACPIRDAIRDAGIESSPPGPATALLGCSPRRVRRWAFALLLTAGTAAAQQPLTAAFTYQGELRVQGAPANASYDMEFRLYPAASGGSPIGGSVAASAVVVSNGLFSIPLDFGPAQFAGERQWLEIRIGAAGSGSFETLAPRSEITAAPYAWSAATALANSVTGSSIVDGSVSAADINPTQVQRRVVGTCSGNQALRLISVDGTVVCTSTGVGTVTQVDAGAGLSGGPITATGALAIADGGVTSEMLADGTVTAVDINENEVQQRVTGVCAEGSSIRAVASDGSVTCETDDSAGSVAPAWLLGGNAGTDPTTQFVGTTDLSALELRTAGVRSLRLEPSTQSFDGAPLALNLVAGSAANSVDPGLRGATIAGGGVPAGESDPDYVNEGPNRVSGHYGSVGGGYNNEAASFGVIGGGQRNRALGNYTTVAGGLDNSAQNNTSTVGGGESNVASGSSGTVAGGGFNAASGLGSAIGGGAANAASAIATTVAGGLENGASGAYASVGGGQGNSASGDHGTIGGGLNNVASGTHSVVAGGINNEAGSGAVVSGGIANRAPGTGTSVGGGFDNHASIEYSRVGGGRENSALAEFSYVGGGVFNVAGEVAAVVSGGNDNAAVGPGSAVAGGYRNVARGVASSIVGGEENGTSGRHSTAGGYRTCAGGDRSWTGGFRAVVRTGNSFGSAGIGCADASSTDDADGDEGSFVWADGQPAKFQTTGPNQFAVRSIGGFYFGSNSTISIPAGRLINTSTGAHLTTGGVWTNVSSRALKSAFEAVDPDAVLTGVLALPITRWQYTASASEGTHLGPVAEDFRAAFGLGNDATSISTVDADGVALAAIQGLAARLESRHAEQTSVISALSAQNQSLMMTIGALEARLRELEAVRMLPR